MTRLERLTSLLSLLQSRRFTPLSEIEKKFGISERTIYRDIRSLEESGLPIAFEKGRGYFVLDRHFLPPLTFSIEEAKSFIFVERLAEKYTDETTFLHFSSALEKIRNKLNDHQLEDFEELQKKVAVYLDKNYTPVYLNRVEQACAGNEVLKIRYKDVQGRTTERKIEPIGITFYSQNWHLIAYCQLRGAYRDFSLARISELKASGEFFDREHMSLSEYIGELEKAESD